MVPSVYKVLVSQGEAPSVSKLTRRECKKLVNKNNMISQVLHDKLGENWATTCITSKKNVVDVEEVERAAEERVQQLKKNTVFFYNVGDEAAAGGSSGVRSPTPPTPRPPSREGGDPTSSSKKAETSPPREEADPVSPHDGADISPPPEEADPVSSPRKRAAPASSSKKTSRKGNQRASGTGRRNTKRAKVSTSTRLDTLVAAAAALETAPPIDAVSSGVEEDPDTAGGGEGSAPAGGEAGPAPTGDGERPVLTGDGERPALTGDGGSPVLTEDGAAPPPPGGEAGAALPEDGGAAAFSAAAPPLSVIPAEVESIMGGEIAYFVMSPVDKTGCNHITYVPRSTHASSPWGWLAAGVGPVSRNPFDVCLPYACYINYMFTGEKNKKKRSWSEIMARGEEYVNKIIRAHVFDTHASIGQYTTQGVLSRVFDPSKETFIEEVESRLQNLNVSDYEWSEICALIAQSHIKPGKQNQLLGVSLFELITTERVKTETGNDTYSFPPVLANLGNACIQSDSSLGGSFCATMGVMFWEDANGVRWYRRVIPKSEFTQDMLQSHDYQQMYHAGQVAAGQEGNMTTLQTWVRNAHKEVEARVTQGNKKLVSANYLLRR
jgi:hypothetical protein